MEINSGPSWQYPPCPPPTPPPADNPSGGAVSPAPRINWIVWWYLLCLNCYLKNYSRRPVAFPKNRFQCVTTSLHPPRSHQTPPPSSLPQASSPQWLSALVPKYTYQHSKESDDDCFEDNKGDESDTDTSDNGSDGGDSDDEVYTWPPKTSLYDMAHCK